MIELWINKSNFRNMRTVESNHPELASNIESWELLGKFDKPVITLFGNKDPISRGMDKELQAHVPGCKGQNHQTLRGVGHCSPEEAPEELANYLLDFIRETD